MLTSFTNRFWSSLSTSERKYSLFQVSYSCENKKDIFQSSKNLYYYLDKKKQFASFVKAPQTNLHYAWESDLEDLISSPEIIKNDRHIIYIWSEDGNEGKTHYIKHKCMNSNIFSVFAPMWIGGSYFHKK